MESTKRVAIGGRVSKDDGSQDPENQLAPLREFAKANGWEVVGEYVDFASGSRSDREQFQKMLSDADSRKFDIILIWSLDRFSREGVSNTVGYFQRLKRAGVAIISLQERWLDTRDDNPTSELLLSIFSWVAAQERKRIVERTKAGLERAKSEGKKLGRPHGSKDKGVRSSHKYFKSFNPKRIRKAVANG